MSKRIGLVAGQGLMLAVIAAQIGGQLDPRIEDALESIDTEPKAQQIKFRNRAERRRFEKTQRRFK